ncbi:tol-pal system YbgF family protein [Bacteroidota bacterium]
MKYIKISLYFLFIYTFLFTAVSCNYTTHRTVSKTQSNDEEDPEPDYDVTLEDEYQDYVSYIYMGNRSESFGTFFNKFYTALDDYDEAMKDYKASTIATYNRRMDSLNIVPAISPTAKEKLIKVIERCSKIIQFNKNTRFIDDAVLLIGKSYYFMGDFLQAERKFNEFLSKLTKSELLDEASLFFGRTKIKLGGNEEGVKILKNLLDNTKDINIKSEAAFDLGINALIKNDYKTSVEYIRNSIKYTDDEEKMAEKHYILAKILTLYDPSKAYKEYFKVIENTSDFDLTYYAKLNYAKSLNKVQKFTEAYSIFTELAKDYREYPEFQQLAELETANNLFLQKQYKKAIQNSYDIIVDYQNTRVAADAYYLLAKYYENVKSDYLDALVNYNKVNEEFSNSDYSIISSKRATTLDRYFTLMATINDTTKTIIPSFNSALEDYRNKRLLEKGLEQKKQFEGQEEEGKIEGKGDGEGFSSRHNKDRNSYLNARLDSIINEKEEDISSNPEKNTDTLTTSSDNEKTKFDAYLELAELFLYELNQTDSAEHYLKIALLANNDPDRESKVLYTLGTLYKKENRTEEANDIFKKIIEENPKSVFANESRKTLGLQTLDVEKDPTESLFKETEQNILTENYDKAIINLTEINTKYPESIYLPKAIYTIGWIYEYALNNKDSAYYYYTLLKDSYPESEFLQVVNTKLDYWASLEKNTSDSTEELKDSNNVINEKELEKENIEGEISNEVLEKKIEEEKQDEKEEDENPDLLKPEEEGIEKIIK